MTTDRQAPPRRQDVDPDEPLRLDLAATIAFRGGSMTAHGLRLEAFRGRLAVFRIAGKTYTTLRDIDRMVLLCRDTTKAPDSAPTSPARRRRPHRPRRHLDHQRRRRPHTRHGMPSGRP